MDKLPSIVDPLKDYIISQDAAQVVYKIPPDMFNGFDWKTARQFFYDVNWEFQGDFPRNVTAVVITCKFR